MITARAFIGRARAHGLGLFAGAPCPWLEPLASQAIDEPSLHHVGAANECDAVAVACGARLGGLWGAVLLSGAGLANAAGTLSSLSVAFGLPTLLIVATGPFAPHEEGPSGSVVEGLLELLGVAHEPFPAAEGDIDAALDRALSCTRTTGRPSALLLRSPLLEPRVAERAPRVWAPPSEEHDRRPFAGPLPSRTEVLRVVQERARAGDLLFATAGLTGRELCALDDRRNQLYMAGAAGCAASFGLGMALAQPSRRVIVLDGDGAALMRLSAMATLGYERPRNLLHLVLDNEAHGDAGRCSSLSHSVDLGAVAQACGYPSVLRATSLDELGQIIADGPHELTMAHVKITGGAPDELPSLTVAPAEARARMAAWLAE